MVRAPPLEEDWGVQRIVKASCLVLVVEVRGLVRIEGVVVWVHSRGGDEVSKGGLEDGTNIEASTQEVA